jgi:hypothetical protein
MATKSTAAAAPNEEHEYMFADWVYTVPGFLLIIAGFGSLLMMTLF